MLIGSQTIRDSYLLKMPMSERRKILLSEFDSFPGDKINCSFEEIIRYLDEKIGYKNFSKEIAEKLMNQMHGGPMNIENFVNQLINLEDTLHFQMQLDNDNVLEVRKKKHDLQVWIEEHTNNFREDVNSNPFLYLNILEASNLESNLDVFVQIYSGAEIYHTQVIKNSRNPIWNESYKIPLPENQNVGEIRLVLTDRERQAKGDFIGSVVVELKSLMDQNMKQFDEFVRNSEGNLTKFKLHFQIKYLFSKVLQYELDIRHLNDEEQKLIEYSQANENLLNELLRPFEKFKEAIRKRKNNKSAFGLMNQPLQQSSILRYHQNEGMIDSLRESWLRVRISEEHLTDRIDDFLRRKKFNDWVKIYLWSSGILVVLAILQAFARAQYPDIMIALYSLGLNFRQEQPFRQIEMRYINIFIIISFISDITWIAIFTEDWYDYYDFLTNQFKTFAIVISYFSLVFKVVYLLIIWRCSVKFKYFKEEMIAFLGIKEAELEKQNINIK